MRKKVFISKCKFPAALSEIYRQPIWEVNLEVNRTRIEGIFGSALFLRRGYETRYPVIVIFSSRISGKSIVLILMEDLVVYQAQSHMQVKYFAVSVHFRLLTHSTC